MDRTRQCKILNCERLYYAKKMCQFHYERDKLGRMSKNGSLVPLPVRVKECESCGTAFRLKKTERNVKWCVACRPFQYKQNSRENRSGVYRTNRNGPREKYVEYVLNKFIKASNKLAKYRKILDLRAIGKTHNAIAKEMGLTKQRVHQICKEYK